MPKIGTARLRREQLIEATMECVDQLGVTGATISRISKQAGVSNGIVHHYFHDKNDLLEATMRLMLAHLKHGVDKKKLAAKSHKDHIIAIIEGNFSTKQIEGKSTKIWLSFWAEALLIDELARLQAVNLRRLNSNLRYHLKHLLPDDEARLIASGLAALIDGLWLRGAFQETGIDAKHSISVCRNYVEMALEIHS